MRRVESGQARSRTSEATCRSYSNRGTASSGCGSSRARAMRPEASGSKTGIRAPCMRSWTSAVMNTVLPAPDMPVTPSRTVGCSKWPPNSKIARAASLASSVIVWMRVGMGNAVGLGASLVRRHVELARRHVTVEPARFRMEPGPIVHRKIDHRECRSREFLQQALPRIDIARCDQELGKVAQPGIVPDDEQDVDLGLRGFDHFENRLGSGLIDAFLECGRRSFRQYLGDELPGIARPRRRSEDRRVGDGV